MVSPASSPNNRFCPALEEAISSQRCGSERISEIECPLSCPHNPFNPNAPQAFDQVLGRGLTAATRWIEKFVGKQDWARRFDEIDRRFHPEQDLPLITFETQWSLIDRSRSGESHPKLWQSIKNDKEKKIRNDARIVIEKLANSRVLLLEVTTASAKLPYYTCIDLLDAENEYLYVDFGDQDPLKVGAVMFGRFLVHENCVYVVPGVFIGSPVVSFELVEAVEQFLGLKGAAAIAKMQKLMPEVWNLCASIQDELDDLDMDDDLSSEAIPKEIYKVITELPCPKEFALERLRNNGIFFQVRDSEFDINPLDETVFKIRVLPGGIREDEGMYDDDDDLFEEEDKYIDVATVTVTSDKVMIAAENLVELELLKELVTALIGNEA